MNDINLKISLIWSMKIKAILGRGYLTAIWPLDGIFDGPGRPWKHEDRWPNGRLFCGLTHRLRTENKGYLRKGISQGHLATRWDFRRSRLAMMADGQMADFSVVWPTDFAQTSFWSRNVPLFKTNLIVQGVKFHACLAYEIVPPDANTVPTINQATVQFNCNFPNVPNIAISFN